MGGGEDLGGFSEGSDGYSTGAELGKGPVAGRTE